MSTAHAIAHPVPVEPPPMVEFCPTSPPSTEVDAETMAMAEALATKPYSDGRIWDGGVVAREIHGYLELGLRAMVEIGRRLHWTKMVLGHGHFLRWLEVEVRFISQRSAYNYMKVADFFLGHPKLLESCAGLGLKKALLLAQLPEELVEQATNLGQVAEIPLEQMDKMSYPELEKQLKAARKEAGREREAREEAEGVAEKKSAQVDDLVSAIHSTDDDELLARVRKMRKTFDDAMALLTSGLDAMVVRADEGSLSPRVRAEVAALVEYQSSWAEYEALRYRQATGGEVFAHQLEDALSRPRPYAARYAIPEDRHLETFDELDQAVATPSSAAGPTRGASPRVVPPAADAAATPASIVELVPANAGASAELGTADFSRIAGMTDLSYKFVACVLGAWKSRGSLPAVVEAAQGFARSKNPVSTVYAVSDVGRAARQVLQTAGIDPDSWMVQQ